MDQILIGMNKFINKNKSWINCCVTQEQGNLLSVTQIPKAIRKKALYIITQSKHVQGNHFQKLNIK